MMNPEMATVPAGGGWRFLQRLPNGQMRPFLTTSKQKLYEEVLLFRRTNNLPTETLERELELGVSSPVTPVRQDGFSLRERVTHWLLGRQFGTVRYVNQEVADERAKLASQDENNVTNYADECIECYQNTTRGLFAIRQGKTTPYDDKLGACLVHGWDNKTAVHLDASCLKGIKPTDPCWCASLLDKTTDSEVG